MLRFNRVSVWLAAAVLLSAAWFAASVCLRHEEKPAKELTRVRKVPAAKNRALSAKAAKGFKVSSSNNTARARRPIALDDDVDENGVKLTAEMKQILAEIQDCLDREDKKALSKVCEKIAMIQRERGEGAVPVSIRAKAVEAVGLFLPASLAELVGFMADSDPEVVDSVFDQLDNLLNDTTIGDRELAGMLVSMSKVLTNEDAVDSLAMAIDMNMRNSVKVDACQQILEKGNEVVVTRLKETIAEMLEVEVDELPQNPKALREKLDEWLAENPDGEDDEDFYKGVE